MAYGDNIKQVDRPSLLLSQAIELRQRAYRTFLLARAGFGTMQEYFRLDNLANLAYRRLSPTEAQAFLKQIRELLRSA